MHLAIIYSWKLWCAKSMYLLWGGDPFLCIYNPSYIPRYNNSYDSNANVKSETYIMKDTEEVEKKK